MGWQRSDNKMPLLGSFQDYLTAAIQLKSALVKAKPGRQEWEQAPPFLRCTAAADASVQRARAGGFSVQYKAAIQLKEEGNQLIIKDPPAALERYSQALSVFLWFDRGQDRASEDVPLVCSAEKLEGAEQDQAYHLLSVSFSNAAACLLQMGMAADAAYACSKALKYDPYNVKALYRRAMAHRQAATNAGLEAAVSDLAAANQLEPANNQVRLALATVQHELREHRKQERGMYSNIFQHGQLYDEHAANATANSSGGLQRAAPAGGAGCVTGSQRRGAVSTVAAASADTMGAEGGWHDATGSEDEDWRRAEPAGGSDELDPEDLLFLDPQKRKVESALASREADLVMFKMQAALARSRNRKMAERLDAERARRAVRFPWWAVPWWAYALIGLHLAYRLIKVWRMPVPNGVHPHGIVQEAGQGLQSDHLDL
ncbi:hypothetical protein Vretimale_17847 [Volvox reticuliferus]|uniref:Uncharacterized protein n=1 Tax=Volvox reticuliferus TaxID=1737510 RepID=A0A8J4GWV0_9CHLO|nr:hypothetical protein Vretimale_17847 [Volvox reticuliferus]